jgi:pimeloyl-ACP methyl ester carboxylesterase
MQFYLVHGGSQGSWSWDGVRRELEQRGHHVVAPTLPGLGRGLGDRSHIGLSDLTDFVVDDIRSNDLADVVLVAHSGAGPIAQGVAEKSPQRLRRLVFLDAGVLLDGESILDLSPERKAALIERAQADPDHTMCVTEDHWVNVFCHDMAAEEARAWFARVEPYPARWVIDEVRLPTGSWRSVPSAFIVMDDRPAIPNPLYERMIARLDNPRIAHARGAHEGILSQPGSVAAAILQVGA